jgi:arylsulfatase A-like enzyme
MSSIDRTVARAVILLMCSTPLEGCGAGDDLPLLTVEMPLHLEDHLGEARVTGSVAPSDGPKAMEWRFDQPQPGWRAARVPNPVSDLATVEATGDALRLTLTDATRRADGTPVGSVAVDVPPTAANEWGDVVVRVRSDSTVSTVNLRVNPGGANAANGPAVPVVRDGTIQTYRLPWPTGGAAPVQAWIAAGRPVQSLGVGAQAPEGPGSIDILSVRGPPIEEGYRDPPSGIRHLLDPGFSRRTLYTNAPSRLEFRIAVPDGGRLDYGLRVLRDDVPVTFRVGVQVGRGELEIMTEEVVSDANEWLQRSVDLSAFGGEIVALVLENDAEDAGAIAFWSAPTVSAVGRSSRPNVIFYVIDTGAADQMSLYGYNRRTTPNLDAIAAEGAVFERAHSTAVNTASSTPSFMTSLHSSVLGGSGDRLPPEAKTMAERFHEAGYPTAVFTWNPNAGSNTGLERGVDVFHDGTTETYRAPSRSSVELHRDFWEWRTTYPGSPYWVHFQTLDVHRPTIPPPPFAGLFAPVGTAERTLREDSILRAWDDNEGTTWGFVYQANPARWEDTGVDRVSHYDARRALYDETMAHQDYQLGRFVERLKLSGEWENTLLVIASDHSIHATDDFLKLGRDADAADEPYILLRSSASWIPLVFIWPGHIPGGQRIRERVSMIDVQPTVLELAGLPQPEILQGQSLVPLLLGRDGWEPRPVIFDHFDLNPQGEPSGSIEVIDGRWGASLLIRERAENEPRPAPVLVYDVDNDPMALHPLNEERPDLVAEYTGFLTRQWEAHQLLAKRFTPGGDIELTTEQVERLRTLGYIR